MKTKNTMATVMTALNSAAHRSMVATYTFTTRQSISGVDSFKAAHPLLQAGINIGGILLLIGACASICSALSSKPYDK